jgi:hypothetical protein
VRERTVRFSEASASWAQETPMVGEQDPVPTKRPGSERWSGCSAGISGMWWSLAMEKRPVHVFQGVDLCGHGKLDARPQGKGGLMPRTTGSSTPARSWAFWRSAERAPLPPKRSTQ